MAEEAAAHHLLNVLEERELDVDLDKILAAFEDEGTKKEAAAWVDEYLNEETLLTKEELHVYQNLKKRGLLHQFENDEEPVRPLMDHEIASAIEALKSSTAAIEEQSKVLETQREALMALKALEKPNLNVEHVRNEKRRREHQEKTRLDIAIEDVSTSINDQLADTQREIDVEKSTLKDYIRERLASDDKILTALPGIVSKIVSEPEVDEDENSIDQWCKAIVSYRTAEVKAKVDATYLTSLANHSPGDLPDVSDEELSERKQALQAELETLHSEIASVAEMVVEHELRKPTTELRERESRERTQSRKAWSNYVLSTLEYMSKRLDTVGSHTKNVDEFQQALVHIQATALQRMPDPVPEVPSPNRKRTISAPKSAFSPAFKFKPTKSLDLPPGLQDALRHVGVSFNQETVNALCESLVHVSLDREKKLEEQYVSASASTQERLAGQLGKRDAETTSILNALYSQSKFKQVSLVDDRLESELNRVEGELDVADRKLLEAETEALSLSDPKVREFVERYG
ncbi:hypothetical protein B0J11DRAFT_533181 [Dendryphion nanum]|uniref:Uncharacterized protein n=1 Tax=Dendryphion nanum TaxID=256645 RepID=A0A9P9DM01_9PLEO|nr:hypothetical protein B0J11DRAFT_533181 [Dendryphion nanum]